MYCNMASSQHEQLPTLKPFFKSFFLSSSFEVHSKIEQKVRAPISPRSPKPPLLSASHIRVVHLLELLSTLTHCSLHLGFIFQYFLLAASQQLHQTAGVSSVFLDFSRINLDNACNTVHVYLFLAQSRHTKNICR